jgi:ABC-2 type transport system ATP-binding protein
MIQVRGLAKRYRRNVVLEDVSFQVPKGMLVGVQGENGAGKSTLLQCLLGLLRADSGSVAIDGRVGYCPQDPSLIEALTMEEQFELFGAGYGMSVEETRLRSMSLSEEFGCTTFAKTRVSQMSGGTRQKVNLIAALLHQPDVLFLDEPYQGLDYETYGQFWTHTEEARTLGRTVVVVSHMHTELDRFDALLDLRAGVIKASGPRAEEVRKGIS